MSVASRVVRPASPAVARVVGAAVSDADVKESVLAELQIASIVVAAAASTLWAAWSENYGALAGIGLDYLVIFIAMAVIIATLDSLDATRRILYTAIAAATALFGLALFLWSRRFAIDPDPPRPTLVRWSFVDPDWTRRAEPDALVQAATGLADGEAGQDETAVP